MDSDALKEKQPARSRPLRILVIAGAKGGVGKTLLATNFGIYLATIGRRVVLVDADASGGNLHSLLGMRPPSPLHHARRLKRADRQTAIKLPEEAFVKTPFSGLKLLDAGLDDPLTGSSLAARRARLIPKLRTIEADYAIVDLGGSVTSNLLDVYLSADLSVFITVPEPTSIENTYRFLRYAFANFLLSRIADPNAKAQLLKYMRSLANAPPPLDLAKKLKEENHPLADTVSNTLEAFEPRVVINQTRLRADLALGYAMRSATRRRLGITIDYIGHIDNDDTVQNCVRNRRPLLIESPGSKSSKKIEKIARRLLMIEAGKSEAANRPSVPVDTHHDLLEVERGATDEEIRRAYKRCRDTYSPHAQCCYGLFEPHELEKLRVRLDEAFDVLLDPTLRRPYELSIFPPEPATDKVVSTDHTSEEEPPPAPEITPDTHITGALLRQTRLSQRVQLHDISHKTKIGIVFLKAIEEDDYGMLPPMVYTSGFVTEFAKYLKLDPQQASRTYIRRYRQYLQERGELRQR